MSKRTEKITRRDEPYTPLSTKNQGRVWEAQIHQHIIHIERYQSSKTGRLSTLAEYRDKQRLRILNTLINMVLNNTATIVLVRHEEIAIRPRKATQ